MIDSIRGHPVCDWRQIGPYIPFYINETYIKTRFEDYREGKKFISRDEAGAYSDKMDYRFPRTFTGL